ncbi:hypothetical protein, partial [Tessaracoccus sp. OH4464_COT-324]|uniref:hypothetical protein n=1 Tax=Tessaracoccus sp. OH4464_COT-324 TaxID=2491059 RepID=UPI001F2DD7B6
DDPNWQQDKRWAGHPPPTIVPPIFHNHVKENWPIPTLTNFIPSKAGFPRTSRLASSWIYVHKDDQDPTTPRPRTIHVSVDYYHDLYKTKTRNFVNPKAVGNAYCGLRGEFKVETCVLVAQDCIIDFALIGPWEGDVNAQMEQLMLELAAELRKQFGTDDQ